MKISPTFLADKKVEIIASMPCYSAANVNAQRGDGVFEGSIAALQLLNSLGYGIDPTLPLHLVYNPVGAFLPSPQDELEADYKQELQKHFGIVFNRLYTLTNLPIGRFAAYLRHNNQLQRVHASSYRGIQSSDYRGSYVSQHDQRRMAR